jgi:hypothetical protein
MDHSVDIDFVFVSRDSDQPVLRQTCHLQPQCKSLSQWNAC